MVSRSGRRRILFAAVPLAAIGAYLVSVATRAAGAYAGLKRGEGWTGRIFEADPELGFRLAPGSVGTEELPSGRSVAVRVDARGFRIPVDATPEPEDGRRHRVLALGSSETFGQACAAEEAFPFLVAKRLDAECLNSGCTSYGLAQILIQARRLIPLHRPGVVLLQHSPWLAERAIRDTAPSLLQSIPTPYFVLDPEGIALRSPKFQTILFDLPVARYLRSPRGTVDAGSFLLRVGAPLLLHDDAERCLALVRRRSEPFPTEAAVAALVHAEVAELCGRDGALLVYVVLGKSCTPIGIEESARRPGVLVVDARAALCADLEPGDREAYYRRYAHYAGDPPVLEDGHPNPRAHGVIADAIVAAIERSR